MNILVINGSPKGKNSITLQTSLLLEKLADRYNFEFIHVGQKIKYYENNMAEAVSLIKNADLILVLKDGDVIESGNHKELIKQKGFYADLYNSQFSLSGMDTEDA